MNTSKDHNWKMLLRKAIFLGYKADNILSVQFYRSLLLFFVLNIFVITLYWFSHLSGQNMSFWGLNIDMPDDLFVMYFAQNIANSLCLTIPVTFIICILQFFSRKNSNLFSSVRSLPDKSWVKRIFLNEVNSVFLPFKSGRVNLSITLLGSIAAALAITYTFIPALYNKLYSEALYTSLFNFGEQNTSALFLWSIIIIAFYQIAVQLLIVAYQMLFIVIFREKELEIMMENK